jgi:Protoglobin
MSQAPNFSQLCEEIKQLSGLTARDEAMLHKLAGLIVPSLDRIADRLFALLAAVRCSGTFIEGREEFLKNAHRTWLRSLFTRRLDADFVQWIYQIGAAHARVELPVEVMTAAMSMVLRELLLLLGTAALDVETKARAGAAISSVCAFSQLIMQRGYGIGYAASETERVQTISDISRNLFDKLAEVYKEYAFTAQAFANDSRADIRPRRRGIYANRSESNRRRRCLPRSHS